MPGGDRTGPYGVRARTGRGLGYCAGYEVPGHYTQDIGRGQGSFGRCRGRRNHFHATGVPGRGYGWVEEVPEVSPPHAARADYLRRETERLRAALADIERRLEAQNKHDTTEG